jgi:hypothetical protein
MASPRAGELTLVAGGTRYVLGSRPTAAASSRRLPTGASDDVIAGVNRGNDARLLLWMALRDRFPTWPPTTRLSRDGRPDHRQAGGRAPRCSSGCASSCS